MFSESQIFRIDHYLGKETVQNLLALRFANALFEPLWNTGHIDHVQITVAETVGVERPRRLLRRAPARCATWCRTTCCSCCAWWRWSRPRRSTPDAVRDEKVKVLRSLRRIDAANAAQLTVRGQYRAGVAEGASGAGLPARNWATPGRTPKPSSRCKADIDNWRWAGVPFYLRTGKRLPSRVSEIVITFKPVPHSIFNADAGDSVAEPAGDATAAGRGREAVADASSIPAPAACGCATCRWT